MPDLQTAVWIMRHIMHGARLVKPGVPFVCIIRDLCKGRGRIYGPGPLLGLGLLRSRRFHAGGHHRHHFLGASDFLLPLLVRGLAGLSLQRNVGVPPFVGNLFRVAEPLDSGGRMDDGDIFVFLVAHITVLMKPASTSTFMRSCHVRTARVPS